jgi:hypothetical protein
MHCLAPRVVLGKDWWDRTRKAAYASTQFHCVACGVIKHEAPKGILEAHELYRINYAKGTMTYVETVPLCNYCHSFIHAGRLSALLESMQISQIEYDTIMKHGKAVLEMAGLVKRPLYCGYIAIWEKWRLVVNGRKYKPRFKSYDSWLKEFGCD